MNGLLISLDVFVCKYSWERTILLCRTLQNGTSSDNSANVTSAMTWTQCDFTKSMLACVQSDDIIIGANRCINGNIDARKGAWYNKNMFWLSCEIYAFTVPLLPYNIPISGVRFFLPSRLNRCSLLYVPSKKRTRSRIGTDKFSWCFFYLS